MADPQVQMNAMGLIWRIEQLRRNCSIRNLNNFGLHKESQNISETTFSQVRKKFVSGVDPLLDVLYVGCACFLKGEGEGDEEVRTILRGMQFKADMEEVEVEVSPECQSEGDAVTVNSDLTNCQQKHASMVCRAVYALCTCDAGSAGDREKKREELRKLDWSCLGNSWEQREVLMAL